MEKLYAVKFGDYLVSTEEPHAYQEYTSTFEVKGTQYHLVERDNEGCILKLKQALAVQDFLGGAIYRVARKNKVRGK